MKQSLINNNYMVIKNFISPERAIKLSDEFRKYCTDNNIDGDPILSDTPAKYNYISFLELLCEKTVNISELIEETVLPSYSYARVYKNNDVLIKHVDRDACDISITLHLDGDKDWSIFVEDPNGKENEITLKKGDALLYLGCDAPHWRNSYSGSFYSQVFLHYVRSRGERSYAFFNNKIQDFFKLKLDNNVEYLKNSSSTIKPVSNLKSFIQVFENIIPDSLCDEIINQYKNDPSWEQSKIVNNIKDATIRNCKILSISLQETISKNQFIRKSIDDRVFEIASSIINQVCQKFPTVTISHDTGYDLLKYETGGFYTQHTDSFTNSPRAISCSFILNDDYEGGEFAFFDQELQYKLKKGSAITFPSNYLYPHEIMPVTSGTRYSIITWFI